jgi:hypothetical protein
LADVRRVIFDAWRGYGKPPGQRGNRPYSSSSVPGKMRRKKSYLDWRVLIDCYVDDWANLPTLQDNVVINLYTTASLSWELKWGRIIGLDDIGAHVEEAELLHVAITAVMQGSDGSSLGWVKNPASTQKWPTVAGT